MASTANPVVAPPTPDEIQGVQKIRQFFTEHSSSVAIPPELDTLYNLNRWYRGYHGNLQTIHTKLSQYIVNRRLLNLDRPDFIEAFYELPKTKQVMQFFSYSRLQDAFITDDNAVVFIEQGKFDKNVAEVVKTSDYLEVFHGNCELALRHILRLEEKTGKPAYGVCLFNCAGVSLTSHLNPQCPANKIFQMRANVWQDFYPEMMQRIVILNPPSLLSFFWKIISFLLNEQAQKLINVVNNHDELFKIVDAQHVPVAYGGLARDKTGIPDQITCCTDVTPIDKGLHYKPGTIWKTHKVPQDKVPKTTGHKVSSGKSHRVTVEAAAGSTLLWHAWASTEYTFTVYFQSHSRWYTENGKPSPDDLTISHQVHPRLQLVTTRVPEECTLACTQSGYYTLLFTNNSHYFVMKLELAVLVL